MNQREKIQISEIKEDLAVLRDYLEKGERDITAIKYHLYDNKNTGQQGLVNKVEQLDKKVDSIVSDLKWAKMVTTGIATALSSLAMLIYDHFR